MSPLTFGAIALIPSSEYFLESGVVSKNKLPPTLNSDGSEVSGV